MIAARIVFAGIGGVALLGARPTAPAPPPAAADPSPARFEVSMEEAWIPMSDGVRLAADLWRPKGAPAGERFPVLLEYLPYRKNEDRGERYAQYSYFVRRGYVVARVDIRGTARAKGRSFRTSTARSSSATAKR